MKAIGFLVVFAVGIITAKNIYDPKKGPEYFEAFIKEYNKQYENDAEKAKRYDIFLNKLEEINFLNEKSEHAEFGINKFSDLTSEEFDYMYNGLLKEASEITCTAESEIANNNNDVGDSFDWRTKGAVTAVKNQYRCGSCWAFSAIANVESVYAIKTGKQVDLSEQQVLDCDERSKQCGGGHRSHALEYLAQYGSIKETDYPYVASNQTCHYDANKVYVKITGCLSFKITDEDKVANKLTRIAPLSIGIASHILHKYKKGILTGSECFARRTNHAVLLVGYGIEDGVPYWIVKNSWGTDWGEDGYFRMKRGANCLLLTNVKMVTAVMN